MKRASFLLAIFWVGCKNIGVCDYPLSEDGWKPVKKPPSSLVDEHNIHDHWFTNKNGDFFACPEMKDSKYCGNVYEIFTHTEDGKYEKQEIACMR